MKLSSRITLVFSLGLVASVGASRETVVLPAPPGQTVGGVRVSGVLRPSAPNIAIYLVREGATWFALKRSMIGGKALNAAPSAFAIAGVPPGTYVLEAITMQNVTWDGAAHQNPRLGVPDGLVPTMWSRQTVTVGRSGLENVVINLKRGVEVRGRFDFSRTSIQPSRNLIQDAEIQFSRSDGGSVGVWQIQVEIDPDGRFIASGFVPGEWKVRAGLAATTAPAAYWRLQTVKLGDRDITGESIRIGDADVSGLTLTFSSGT